MTKGGEEQMKRGECRYCHNIRMVEAPDGATQEELDELASKQCDCPSASKERRKKEAFSIAFQWADGIFEELPKARLAVMSSIEAILQNEVSRTTIKIGKNTYQISLNKDGEIQIKTVFKEEDLLEF